MTISVRNLPARIEAAILETSRSEGISLNKATIRILEESIHKPGKNHEFDEFLGGWSKKEADTFGAAIADMRRVEAFDWGPDPGSAI